jgi:cell shape-determining protein MreC
LVLTRVVSKHRTVILLCLVLVGALVSITADVSSSLIVEKLDSLISYGFYPFQKGVAALQDVASDAFGAVMAVGRLRLQSERLEETVELLQSKVVRTRELEKENERLRKLLGFAEKRGSRAGFERAVADGPGSAAVGFEQSDRRCCSTNACAGCSARQ